MTPSGDGHGSYHVECSTQIGEKLKQFQRKATEAGQGGRLLAAVKTIYERLRRDPLSFGEPVFRLKKLKLQIRKAVVPPLVVEYGVHDEKPLVSFKISKSSKRI